MSHVTRWKGAEHVLLVTFMFQCPIPEKLLHHVTTYHLLLDLVPILVSMRRNDRHGFFFQKGHGISVVKFLMINRIVAVVSQS